MGTGGGKAAGPAARPEAPSQPTVLRGPSRSPGDGAWGTVGSIEAGWETEPVTPGLRCAVSRAG